MPTPAISRIVLCVVLALTMVSRVVSAAPPEITQHKDGWYKQRFKSAGVAYLADTISRACFAVTSGGMTEMNCKSLKRRPEWDAIISWEKRFKAPY